jgi:hypothetical protein
VPVSSSQVAARLNRLIGLYRAMSRSRAWKLWARDPRSANSARMLRNTHLVMTTGMARGTTRVMIADSTVVTTSSAPATKAHRQEVRGHAASSSRRPGRYRPRRRASARTLAASLARSRGTHTRLPPAPVSRTNPSNSRPHRSGRRGSGSSLEGMPASASTARTLEASSGVRKFPSRRRGAPGGSPSGPASIPGSSHLAAWAAARRLPTMFPAHAASLGNQEASPSLVYGARLLSGFGVNPPSCVRIALPPLRR